MEVLVRMDRKLNRIEKILKKLTVDIEEEARSIIKYRLREMGVDVDIDVLKLPDFELNIYGVSDNICVVGEASLRAGASIIDELKRKLNTLKTNYPGYLRGKCGKSEKRTYLAFKSNKRIRKTKNTKLASFKSTTIKHPIKYFMNRCLT